jgi:hypothetical protein
LPASEGRNWPKHTTAVIAIRSDNLAVVDRKTLTIFRKTIGKKRVNPTPETLVYIEGSNMELVYHQKCTCKCGAERISVALRVLKSAVSGDFCR